MRFVQFHRGYFPFIAVGLIILLLIKLVLSQDADFEAKYVEEAKKRIDVPKGADDIKISSDCKNREFLSVPIGSKGEKAYYMSKIVPLTWFEAVCCCLSRGLNLIGPTTAQDLKDTYVAGEAAGVRNGMLGWADFHGYSGVWKSLYSGNVLSKDLLARGTEPIPPKGHCLELQPTGGGTYVLSSLHGSLSCNRTYSERFFCVVKTPFTIAAGGPNPDCFGECDYNSIITYAENGTCQEDSSATPSPNPTPNIAEESCLRNCNQTGWCAGFKRCVAVNGTWEWDDKSESYLGEWQSFDCPGDLYWNSKNSAFGTCDFWENLPPETRTAYKRDQKCWESCTVKAHEEKSERCAGKFWSINRRNPSSRLLDSPVLRQCPNGTIFNSNLGTCTKCVDANEIMKSECCPPKVLGRAIKRYRHSHH